MTIKTFSITTSLLATTLLLSHQAMASQQWPDLPVGVKNGVGAQVGDKVYVGLGSAGSDFYMLDLEHLSQGWQKQASFIGPNRGDATASVIGDSIYVFGGSGKANANTALIIFNTVYRYNTASNVWSKTKTTTPVGLLGASSYSPDNEHILFFGGYNKAYFDQYMKDLASTDQTQQPDAWQKIVNDYMSMKPLDYKWNRDVISYQPATGTWSDLGESPYLPNCGSALVANGHSATLISGEIKPGLRTAEVKQYDFGAAQPWHSQIGLPALTSSGVQEGIAGAFAGDSNGVLIVAGGANFHGAKAAFENGHLFVNNGLDKAYNSEMYIQNSGLWKQVNNLPEGVAYGRSFSINNGVLVAGGEKSDRSASNKVYLLAWNGSAVDVED